MALLCTIFICQECQLWLNRLLSPIPSLRNNSKLLCGMRVTMGDSWHQVKNKIKGTGISIQRDTKNTNGKALPKDNLGLNEGFKKKTWQKQV